MEVMYYIRDMVYILGLYQLLIKHVIQN